MYHVSVHLHYTPDRLLIEIVVDTQDIPLHHHHQNRRLMVHQNQIVAQSVVQTDNAGLSKVTINKTPIAANLVVYMQAAYHPLY